MSPVYFHYSHLEQEVSAGTSRVNISAQEAYIQLNVFAESRICANSKSSLIHEICRLLNSNFLYSQAEVLGKGRKVPREEKTVGCVQFTDRSWAGLLY